MIDGSSGRAMSIVVPLPPSYRGGTEEYAYRTAQRFAQAHPVRVFTTSVRWMPEAPMLDVHDVELHRLPAREIWERPVLGSGAWGQLRSAIEQSEVLQLHMPFPIVEARAVRAARTAGTPTVLTYHMDADLAGARGGVAAHGVTHAYRALSAHPALREADAVVSNSWEYARTSPVLSHYMHKVRVIHKGVDTARLGVSRRTRTDRKRPASVPAEAVPEGRARLLTVGRLVPYKGLPVLLEAVRLMTDCFEDVVLLVAGRGPMQPKLESEAKRLGIEDRVRFLGFVPDEEIGPLYRFADVVVAPSIGSLESTATTLEEAAMCGTPVVGSDLPGTSETVPNDGRRGLLVPPGDPHLLSRAIVRMIETGRPATPIPLRTWEDTAREYLELFRELGAFLPGRPSSPVDLPTRAPAGWPAERPRPARPSWSGWAGRRWRTSSRRARIP